MVVEKNFMTVENENIKVTLPGWWNVRSAEGGEFLLSHHSQPTYTQTIRKKKIYILLKLSFVLKAAFILCHTFFSIYNQLKHWWNKKKKYIKISFSYIQVTECHNNWNNSAKKSIFRKIKSKNPISTSISDCILVIYIYWIFVMASNRRPVNVFRQKDRYQSGRCTGKCHRSSC